MRKRIALSSSLALVAACIAASAGVGSTASSAGKAATCTATIGDIVPATGVVAVLGSEQLHFAQLGIADFNRKYKTNITLIVGDDQFQPAQTTTVAQQFVSNSKIVATVGPSTTDGINAAGAILTRAHLASVSPSATPADQNPTVHKYSAVFSVIAPESTEGRVAAKYLANPLHAKKVFVVDDQASFSIAFTKALKAQLTKDHIPFYSDSVSQAQTDFTSLVSKITPDTDYAFVAFGAPSKGQQLGKQLQEQGKKTVIFGADGLNSPSEFNIEGSYVMSFAPDIRQIPADKAIVKEATAKFGHFTVYGGPSYAAAWVIASAIRSVCNSGKPVTRDNVLEAVKNTNLKTSVLGRPISFDKAGGLTGAKRYVFHIVHGKYVLVGSGS
jgi:branched-chain amino acid transport system substrate-binding protein